MVRSFGLQDASSTSLGAWLLDTIVCFIKRRPLFSLLTNSRSDFVSQAALVCFEINIFNTVVGYVRLPDCGKDVGRTC